jgi:hypothetical protein
LHEYNPWHVGTSDICSNEVGAENTTEELKETPLQVENRYKEKDRDEYIKSMLETRLR